VAVPFQKANQDREGRGKRGGGSKDGGRDGGGGGSIGKWKLFSFAGGSCILVKKEFSVVLPEARYRSQHWSSPLEQVKDKKWVWAADAVDCG